MASARGDAARKQPQARTIASRVHSVAAIMSDVTFAKAYGFPKPSPLPDAATVPVRTTHDGDDSPSASILAWTAAAAAPLPSTAEPRPLPHNAGAKEWHPFAGVKKWNLSSHASVYYPPLPPVPPPAPAALPPPPPAAASTTWTAPPPPAPAADLSSLLLLQVESMARAQEATAAEVASLRREMAAMRSLQQDMMDMMRASMPVRSDEHHSNNPGV